MLTFNFSPFPDLQTERLLIKQITATAAQDLFSLRSDSRVMKYIDRPVAESIDDALSLIAKIDAALQQNEGITWGMYLKANEKLIGTIGFWRIDKANHRAEIGYMLRPELQGKGLMQEAISRAIKFGFEEMHLHSIEANVNPLNLASKNILEKNNFVQEAYFKENYYYNGTFLDSAIYSLLCKNVKMEM